MNISEYYSAGLQMSKKTTLPERLKLFTLGDHLQMRPAWLFVFHISQLPF
jgi:hypothetical protein